MQGEYFDKIQPNYHIFVKCHLKIRHQMKQNKTISIIICGNEKRSYYPDFTICPIIRIDINQLVLGSIDNPFEIQELNIMNQSQRYFFLDSRVLQKISQKYSKLRTIFLSKCNIGDKGIKMLQKTRLNSLQDFDLGGNQLTKQAMKVLAACRIKRLSLLHINNNRIGNAGLSYLAKADWPNLLFLNVNECNLSMDVARVICKAHWPKLQSVYLKGHINQLLYIRSVKCFVKEFHPRFFQDHFLQYLRWQTTVLLSKGQDLKLSYKKFKNKVEQDQGVIEEDNEEEDEHEEENDQQEDDEYEESLFYEEDDEIDYQ